MNPADLKRRCAAEINEYVYSVPHNSLGHAWSPEKVNEHLRACEAALVDPYEQTIELRDSLDQISAESAATCLVWIVADDGSGHRVYFDSSEEIFGLVYYSVNDSNLVPHSAGVKGDFVGTFLAR